MLVGYTYPPEQERYAVLIRNIMHEAALADILVLQEVSDPFLSRLLGDRNARQRYPYTSHAPSNQSDIGPLGSMRNIVVRSNRPFTWEWLSFQRRHKGAVVISLQTIGRRKGSNFLPVIITAVHLTCGLSNSSVAAEKSQLQSLLKHLAQHYSQHPWLVAGDFNLTTSAFTIDTALKAKSISQQAVATLSDIEVMLLDACLIDTWYAARVKSGAAVAAPWLEQEIVPVYAGEEGATFDPLNNPPAAETLGGSPNSRPQRYDRILLRDAELLKVANFGRFGFSEQYDDDTDVLSICGSDHWGIRASFLVQDDEFNEQDEAAQNRLRYDLKLQKATSSISSVADLESFLVNTGMFPTEHESRTRREAFTLLENVLQRTPSQGSSTSENFTSHVIIKVVPVGSYALGVWNVSSDINVLCVGNISPTTFFKLATQKLRRAAGRNIRIVRRVAAASGKMLEIEVRGIKVELHYCAATRVLEP